MTDLLRDLRQGFRLLWRAPGFAVTAILTLALGIGATTALFTVVNAVLLEPLPFPDSNKLIQVWRSELPALTYGSASYRALPRLAAASARVHRPRRLVAAWLHARRARRARSASPGAMASASFFSVIGAPPVIGRYFSDDEDRRGAAKVAVISEGLWRRRYQQSASVARRDRADRRRGLTPIDRRRAVRVHRSVAARRVDSARPGRRSRPTAAATSCCRSANCATA